MAKQTNNTNAPKTQAAHPDDKVEIINTHDRVGIVYTDKSATPGRESRVHPMIAKKLIKAGKATYQK